MSVRYHVCINFGNMSFMMGTLCISLLSAQFNLVGSKHNYTFSFG